MTEELIFRSDEATRGGLQAVQKVEGILLTPERVAAKTAEFTTSDGRVVATSDQVKIVLDDAVILEMEEGEPEPELPEGRYTLWINYAKPGKPKAHQNTFYVKGFCGSAEKLCDALEIPSKMPDGQPNPEYGIRHFFNTRVVLERQDVYLFTPRDKAGEKLEEVWARNFVFAAGEGEASVDLGEHCKSKIVNKSKHIALRAILTDAKLKRHPEFREAINNDTIAEMVGLTVDDAGIYREPAEE